MAFAWNLEFQYLLPNVSMFEGHLTKRNAARAPYKLQSTWRVSQPELANASNEIHMGRFEILMSW